MYSQSTIYNIHSSFSLYYKIVYSWMKGSEKADWSENSPEKINIIKTIIKSIDPPYYSECKKKENKMRPNV